MGRPRKQRPTQQSQEACQETCQEAREEPTVEMPIHDSMMETSMDLDMAFMGMDDDSLSFLDILYPDTNQDPPDETTSHYVRPSYCAFAKEAPVNSSIWSMDSDRLLTLDLAGNSGQAAGPNPALTAPSLVSPDVPEETPGQTPDLTSSEASSPSESPPTTCGCLASLYLALDAMQHLPTDVVQAVKATRTASKTAHDTIFCPVCGTNPPEDFSTPLLSLQSMLLLGALLPSLCNAYKQILQMVDGEAAKAAEQRRQIAFALSDYGGFWGQFANKKPACCGSPEDFAGGRLLDPYLWRSTVRALLRMDVYGVSYSTQGGSFYRSVNQPGLKDIIAMLEERSRSRHERLDALVEAGTLVPPPGCDYMPLASGERPTCLRIVDMAKKSMSELIIP